MAKLNSLFEEFLHNIEPDTKAVKYAQSAHQPIREHLEKDQEFKRFFQNSFLYGSYRRNTAVGEIKDVDMVVVTKFNPQTNNPKDVLRKLKKALNNYYKDSDGLVYQRRSIRVDYPLGESSRSSLTLDVIPAIAPRGEDQPLIVPDRELNKWIYSHPKGHIQHSQRLNSEAFTNGAYVPLVKMMKWWWKYQCKVRQPEAERPKPKGFWVECLTGENCRSGFLCWAEHFIATLRSISTKYSLLNSIPTLKDPGLQGEVIKTNMTVEEFKLFLQAAKECLTLAEQALQTEDELASSEIWREIFGDKFPLAERQTFESTSKLPLADTSHVQKLPWPEQITHTVRIDTYVYTVNKRTKLSGLNSDGRTISEDRYLKYIAKTNVKLPYTVYWQVVNTGEHARQQNCLRGNIFNGTTECARLRPYIHRWGISK